MNLFEKIDVDHLSSLHYAYPEFYEQSLPALEKALDIETDEDVQEMMEEAIDEIEARDRRTEQ